MDNEALARDLGSILYPHKHKQELDTPLPQESGSDNGVVIVMKVIVGPLKLKFLHFTFRNSIFDSR